MAELKSAHLAMIPEFSGEVELLPRFISICEDMVREFYDPQNPGKFQNKFLMSSILSKIKGEAQMNISSLVISRWEDLNKALIATYADKRDIYTLTIEMSSLRQNDLTPFEFHQKIQNFINLQVSYLATHGIANAFIIQKFLSDLGLRVLLRGLRDPIGSLLRTKNPGNLNEALNILVNDFQIDLKISSGSKTPHTTSKQTPRYTPPHRQNTQFQAVYQPNFRSNNQNFRPQQPQHQQNYQQSQRFNQQFQRQTGNFKAPSNNFKNVWANPPPQFNKPTPMSGVSRNTNFNNIDLTEQEHDYQHEYTDYQEHQDHQEYEIEEAENFRLEASETQ
ncbi:hypothetical protein M8J77_012155 [Diaphorina citri]|nr:hypothetical protein M8J77_012155 [Diaphorina citri]